MRRHRVVVITPDVLTHRMAGPAIRAWQIATALAGDHDVELVTTTSVCERSSPAFAVRAAGEETLRQLESWADVVVVQGFVLENRPWLRSSAKVMVVDLYDPLHLEQLELFRDHDDPGRWSALRRAVVELNLQLLRGDFFLCASHKQRDFWLGHLSGLGRVNPASYDDDETLSSLVAVVPFGVPDEAPVHRRQALKGVVPGIVEGDEVILWGGGVYDWLDPLTLVGAIDRLRHRRPRARLFFMGLKHPNPFATETRMAAATRQLAGQLELTGRHVFFNDEWVEYGDRQNYLLEADVGVSTHLDHVETAFSFRTRILDYLWAGLPVVTTDGDALGDIVTAEDLGITVPAGDVEALADGLFRLLDDQALAESCRQRSRALREQWTWSEVLRPLMEFCHEPRRAPDLLHPESGTSWLAPVTTGHLSPSGWRRDLEMAGAHLRRRDFGLLVSKIRSRLARVLAAGP